MVEFSTLISNSTGQLKRAHYLSDPLHFCPNRHSSAITTINAGMALGECYGQAPF